MFYPGSVEFCLNPQALQNIKDCKRHDKIKNFTNEDQIRDLVAKVSTYLVLSAAKKI
jgi:hypothetical protein